MTTALSVRVQGSHESVSGLEDLDVVDICRYVAISAVEDLVYVRRFPKRS
jgi:hypothetical protein